MAIETATPADLPLGRNRNFLLFVVGRTANVVAIHALTTAIGWDVYQLTGDAFDLGLIGLVQFAPALALFLVAGIAADRMDRRKILWVSAIVHAVVTLFILRALAGGVDAFGTILALLAVHGVARAFYHTASQALLPTLVAPAQFPNAIAWSSSANKAAQLMGPAAAGLLIALIGQDVYWPILALFVLVALTSALIARPAARGASPRIDAQTVLGGFVYIWRAKIVLGAVSIDLVAVLFGGVMGLLPVYASDILNVGPEGLGVMRAMPGVGSLAVGLVLTQLAAPRHMGPMMFWGLGLFGVSVIVFSLSEVFWLSLVALALYGAGDMVSVYVRQTLVQIATPDDMRGRVSAVNSIAINASNELGDFRAGVAAAAIGVVPAVLVGGIVTCGATALWAWRFPEIRKIDRLRDVGPTS